MLRAVSESAAREVIIFCLYGTVTFSPARLGSFFTSNSNSDTSSREKFLYSALIPSLVNLFVKYGTEKLCPRGYPISPKVRKGEIC